MNPLNVVEVQSTYYLQSAYHQRHNLNHHCLACNMLYQKRLHSKKKNKTNVESNAQRKKTALTERQKEKETEILSK